MSRSISYTVEKASAAYALSERQFSRVTFTVTAATNVPTAIFVVSVNENDEQKLVYVATPDDLQSVPDDTPNDAGLLRVDTITLYHDRPAAADAVIEEIKQRIQLLLNVLKALDTADQTTNYTLTD